jgi:nudix-type nucleoside diphosphatase (YffH/AdpP family)
MKYEVKEQLLVFNSAMKVEEAEITFTKDEKTSTYSRQRLLRDDAVGVLIYNSENDSIILTRQFRYAIWDKSEPVLEIMAGKISRGEKADNTAIREAEEECGYTINKKNLEFISSVFASPGYTSEKFYLYFASVTNLDKKSEGGGLEQENEYIDVVEMPVKEFVEMAKSYKFEDSKTLITAQWFLLNKIKPKAK